MSVSGAFRNSGNPHCGKPLSKLTQLFDKKIGGGGGDLVPLLLLSPNRHIRAPKNDLSRDVPPPFLPLCCVLQIHLLSVVKMLESSHCPGVSITFLLEKLPGEPGRLGLGGYVDGVHAQMRVPCLEAGGTLDNKEGPRQGPDRKQRPSWPLTSGSGTHRKVRGAHNIFLTCPAQFSKVGKEVAGI